MTYTIPMHFGEEVSMYKNEMLKFYNRILTENPPLIYLIATRAQQQLRAKGLMQLSISSLNLPNIPSEWQRGIVRTAIVYLNPLDRQYHIAFSSDESMANKVLSPHEMDGLHARISVKEAEIRRSGVTIEQIPIPDLTIPSERMQYLQGGICVIDSPLPHMNPDEIAFIDGFYVVAAPHLREL